MFARSSILTVSALALAMSVGGCRKPQGPVTNEANSTAAAAPLNPAPPAPEDAAAIRVSQAWIAPGPDSATLYFTIDNDGGADRLTGIDATGVGTVTLHDSRNDGGVMRMRALPDGIAVAGHGQTVLAPMGRHAMIEPLARPLRPGDEAMLTLHFARQGDVESTAAIHKLGEAM